MKNYAKLSKFPTGAIRAQGFLKKQMEIGKEGMSGQLYKLEPDMIANPFVNKTHVKAWGDGDQSGWGAEISGNYWAGYIAHAYILNDPDMIKVAEEWVEGVLKNQKEDGYLGTYFEDDANIYDDYNAWGTRCGMRALLAFYEVTGRKDVLDAVHRCMLWFCDKWAGDKKTLFAGVMIVETMILTYHLTGDERLVKFAEEYLEYYSEHDMQNVSYKSMLYNEYRYNTFHSGGFGCQPRLPAMVYTATGKKIYLEAVEKFIKIVREKTIQLTGGAVSNTEFNGPIGATQETEYCCFAFANQLYSYMSYITGNAQYGDFMEEVFYNGAQGARKKDEKAIPYLSAPNQIYATEHSSRVYRDQQAYTPCFPTSCCPVNAVAIVPDFIGGMLLRDNDNNVYATAYGPCSLEYEDIKLNVNTLYPFRNNVTFEIGCNKKFALNLKIPCWSKGYAISINGEIVSAQKDENGYAKIERKWKENDVVEIKFDAEVEVIKVDDSDASSKYPIAVKYGALLYSYHIPEKWIPTKGRPMTELPEGWSWYNVEPDFVESDVADAHEQLLMRREQYTWNVAVDENLSKDDFEIEELPENGYAWSNPPIKLHTHCYKAPYLNTPYEGKTFEPCGEYQYVTKKLPLELVPHGCTNLRITYFPKADLKNRK